jgi:hypothetical protein
MGLKKKKTLLVTILVILLLPMIQMCIPFVDHDGLYGYSYYAPNVDFSWDKWFDGSYQNKKDSFYNDNMGLRPELVRVNNQIEYSIYTKTPSSILGKNQCLFFDDYIYTYMGFDYLGYPTIHDQLSKLKAIQDTLGHLGKSLVIVHAPCKSYFYPEDIPDKFYKYGLGPTNFNTMVRLGDSLGLNQIDMNTWFVAMKKTSKELLYTKAGTHWSMYGAWICGDSIVRYLEKLRKIKMLHPKLARIERVINPRNTDDDILRMANLLFPMTNEVYSYPIPCYPVDQGDSSIKKPSVIFIGDSFIVTLIQDNFIQTEFQDWQYWYYFRLIANKDYAIESQHSPLNDGYWKDALNKTDVVVILYTARTLKEKFNGFVDSAYNYYYPQQSAL